MAPPASKAIPISTPSHPLVRAFRITRLLLHLAHGTATTLFLLPGMTSPRREARIREWSGKFLHILNIRVIASGAVPDHATSGTLFIANHISWIDIWALKQIHPINFVAKSEVRQWPLIGWLAEKTGTIFIERARRHDTGRTANGMEQGLREGKCLCLFPEGTTTDGTELKPFKTGLMQAAINAGGTIRPVAIRYPKPDGTPNTAVAYEGDTTLLESLAAVLSQREIIVELHFAPPLPASGQDRRHLSHLARHAISSLLHLPKHKAPETHGDPPDGSP